MIKKERDGVEWLEFELFQEFKELRHGVFLRKGGVSTGALSSLNIGFKSGDSQENILENLSRALSCLGLKEWKRGKLDHGHNVIALEDYPEEPRFLYDGLMTRKKDVGLVITHADCQAVILFDPITKTLANIHSGWKGSRLNILGKVVGAMQERFSCKPENIFAGISPSLGPEEAEFIHYKKELPESFWGFKTHENYFDFWEISAMQLREAGIKESHIDIARIPTRQNEDDFFSYRRDKSLGRNATIAALN